VNLGERHFRVSQWVSTTKASMWSLETSSSKAVQFPNWNWRLKRTIIDHTPTTIYASLSHHPARSGGQLRNVNGKTPVSGN